MKISIWKKRVISRIKENIENFSPNAKRMAKEFTKQNGNSKRNFQMLEEKKEYSKQKYG